MSEPRRATLEAMALLVLAWLLVRTVPLGRWRRLLGGECTAPNPAGPCSPAARRLAAAVERAAARLPFTPRCLPRAIALHWMLARRGIGAQLVIGARPRARRQGRDDLHAWVEHRGAVLIGAIDEPFRPVLRLARHGRTPRA